MDIYNITFDAHDPATLGRFWSQVLDRPLGDTSEWFAFIDRETDRPTRTPLNPPPHT